MNRETILYEKILNFATEHNFFASVIFFSLCAQHCSKTRIYVLFAYLNPPSAHILYPTLFKMLTTPFFLLLKTFSKHFYDLLSSAQFRHDRARMEYQNHFRASNNPV